MTEETRERIGVVIAPDAIVTGRQGEMDAVDGQGGKRGRGLRH